MSEVHTVPFFDLKAAIRDQLTQEMGAGERCGVGRIKLVRRKHSIEPARIFFELGAKAIYAFFYDAVKLFGCRAQHVSLWR